MFYTLILSKHANIFVAYGKIAHGL